MILAFRRFQQGFKIQAKINQKSIKNRSKLDLGGVWEPFARGLAPINGPRGRQTPPRAVWRKLGNSIFNSKSSKSSPKSVKIGKKSIPKAINFFIDFWIDFWWIFDPKIDQKSIKTRCKNQVCFWMPFGSIFD